jgi:hypothetical protein
VIHTSFRLPISFSKSNDSSFNTRRSNNSGRLNVEIYSLTKINSIRSKQTFCLSTYENKQLNLPVEKNHDLLYHQ